MTVKIPGEIDVQRARRILEELRRRLADPQRPQIELDYLERLLKDYLGVVASLPFLSRAASASATAVRMSATENGFVTTSWTIALRPCALALIGKAGHQQNRQLAENRAPPSAPAQCRP